MELTRYSTELHSRPRNISESKHALSNIPSETNSNQSSSRTSTPQLPPVQTTTDDRKFAAKLFVLWPLALHFLGSFAIYGTLIYGLDGRQLYLDRQPQVKLANGTYESNLLRYHNILQKDINTILSVSLMLLRWVAAAWAAPLCWRIIVLLGTGSGLRRNDIKWMTSYGVLPPAAHLRNTFNLLAGLVLIFTIVPYLASPVITGAISWVPSSSTIELLPHPTIGLTGLPQEPLPGGTPGTGGDAAYSFDTYLVKNFILPWSSNADDHVFKRVVPSASLLNINSTVENVTVPVFGVTAINWFSKAITGKDIRRKLQAMQLDATIFPKLELKLIVPGAAVLVVNATETLVDPSDPMGLPPATFSVLINVGKERFPESCNSSTTFLPSNTSIPYFPLDYDYTRWFLQGCFAYANVSYNAASGTCRKCRIGSFSTVQNDTEIEEIKTTFSTKLAIRDMPQFLPTLSPLKDSLPDPGDSLDAYVTALLTRSYSASWNTWNDAFGELTNSTYHPAIPTLKAEIDQKRLYVWLILQLCLTLAGLAFIWLQSTSSYPIIVDTGMLAFDIDSTEVTKQDKQGRQEMLNIKPSDSGWKVLVVPRSSGHSSE